MKKGKDRILEKRKAMAEDPVTRVVAKRESPRHMKLSYFILLMLGMVLFLGFLCIHTGYFSISSAHLPLLFKVTMAQVELGENSSQPGLMLDALQHHQTDSPQQGPVPNASEEQSNQSPSLSTFHQVPTAEDHIKTDASEKPVSPEEHSSLSVNPKHFPTVQNSTENRPAAELSQHQQKTEASFSTPNKEQQAKPSDSQKSKPAAVEKQGNLTVPSFQDKPEATLLHTGDNPPSHQPTLKTQPTPREQPPKQNVDISTQHKTRISPPKSQTQPDLSSFESLKSALSHLSNIQNAPKTATKEKPEIVNESEDYSALFEASWQRSAVWDKTEDYVGDSPLFPPCLYTNTSWGGYTFVEPFNYLNNSKNPCWYEDDDGSLELSCLPYFYLAGVAKGGTSDLARRLRMHPEMFKGTQKEYHWWERSRYGFFDEDDPETPVDMEGGTPFKDYIWRVTGREIYQLEKELDEKGSSVRIFGDFSPSYLWDPHNWYVLEGNQGCQEPRVVVGQHIHHVFPRAKIVLTFRHPTPRLYSRFVSRIPRTPSLRGSTPQDFHRYVVDGIEQYKACFKDWSIRHCAYNVSVYRDSVVRLVEGMYPVFMADWLRIWPKEQMFIMRYEDYGGQERERISEVYEFLGLSKLPEDEMEEVASHQVVNSGSDEYHRYGLMLDKTRRLLDDFYQPFIDKFATLLQDDRFLWKDVEH